MRRPKLQMLIVHLTEPEDGLRWIDSVSSNTIAIWQELGTWRKSLRLMSMHFWLHCYGRNNDYGTNHDLKVNMDMIAKITPTSKLPALDSVRNLSIGAQDGAVFPGLLAAMVNSLPALEHLEIGGQCHKNRPRLIDVELARRKDKLMHSSLPNHDQFLTLVYSHRRIAHPATENFFEDGSRFSSWFDLQSCFQLTKPTPCREHGLFLGMPAALFLEFDTLRSFSMPIISGDFLADQKHPYRSLLAQSQNPGNTHICRDSTGRPGSAKAGSTIRLL